MDLQPIIDDARTKVRGIMERDGTPGAAVALVRADEVVWMECFGATRAKGGRPIDAHTIFSLQSTSKTFTAVAVMLAVQRGLLDLGAPITSYLPEFTVRSRHEQNPEARMTLRHLLSHRAGFTHEAPLGGNFDPELETRSPNFEAHVASIADTWLRYPVGQRYAYSNLGIDLAGAALSRVMGAPFAEALRGLIFEPLGMADTTADAAVYGARENRAIGHQPGYAAVPARIPIEASGGVYSSIADMPRFARLLMHHGVFEGRTLLERRLWDEMHTPPFPGVPYALGILGLPFRYERGAPVLMNHNGGGYGFGSSFTYCPDEDLAWIVLYNGSTRVPAELAPFDAVALLPALEARLGPPAPHPMPEVAVVAASREALAPYCGSYVAGQAIVTAGWEGDSFVVHTPMDAAPNPLAFTGPLEAYVASGPLAGNVVRLHPPAGLQPARLEVQIDEGSSLRAFMTGGGVDFNEGDEPGPPGPVGGAYDALLGDYQIIAWGVPLFTIPLSKANGWLRFGHMRMAEHAPGLFFSPDGEALDLTGPTASFRNIPLYRVAAR
jgi:CubicO group peptidase (beta-lactamase class C family)